jgi:hypothetical protein
MNDPGCGPGRARHATKEPTLLEQNRPEVKTLDEGFYVSILAHLGGL